MIPGVRDVQAAIRSERHTIRFVEQRQRGRTAVAAEAIAARSGNRRDDAVHVYTADPIVAPIGNVKRAVRSHGDALGITEHRRSGGTPVSTESPGAGSRNRGNDATHVHPTHPLTDTLYDVHAAIRPDGDTCRNTQLGLRGRSTIAHADAGNRTAAGGC